MEIPMHYRNGLLGWLSRSILTLKTQNSEVPPQSREVGFSSFDKACVRHCFNYMQEEQPFRFEDPEFPIKS